MRSRRTYDKYGYKFKTKFEVFVADQLEELGVKWEYETITIDYIHDIRGTCRDCGGSRVARTRVYCPDFVLFDTGVGSTDSRLYLEAKGLFKSTDRSKHVAIKKQHGDYYDIRFVFQRNNWLTKTKTKKYSDWCDQKGFKWTIQQIPADWILNTQTKN